MAIKGSDFVIESGKITALIGPNGAGKTTLFDIICGLITPDNGRILFKNKEITHLEPFDRANLGIARTFQQVRLFKYLTIAEHLRMIEDHEDTKLFKTIVKKRSASLQHDMAQKRNILHEFGIDHSHNAHVSDLSYGQRKLLHIAMAVHKKHELLMLDEPVAGVNSVLQEKIEDMLLRLKKKGETMLLIDHDMRFIRRLADHVIMLDAGAVLTQGTPHEVLQDPRVLEAYLGE